MYVLLPHTGLAGGDGTVPQHRSLLYFNPDKVMSGRKDSPLEFQGVELSFRGLPSGVPDHTFREGVVDLRPYTGVTVSKDHLTGNPSDHLEGRVVLPAGAMDNGEEFGCWKMRQFKTGTIDEVKMTNIVQWELPPTPAETPLTITYKPLGGGDSHDLITFYPSEKVIELVVSHAFDHDMSSTQEPPNETIPDHFHAYYELHGGKVDENWPRYKRGGCS
ncbi:MAG: hypothetical protein JO306_16675, partial [Gemmatimonadetes bacterium]|nr:hypothetical protein [Gemmatimonadota bacterium]